MIRRIQNIVLFIFLLQSITSAQQNWQRVSPFPLNLNAYSSSVTGNKAYFWCAENIVFSTNDGGNSFTVYPNYAPANNGDFGCCNTQGISFADSLTGYITDLAHGEFITTDGGFNWKPADHIIGNSKLVKFSTPKTGWKFSDDAAYKTTDAGATWSRIPIPNISSGIITKIFALGEKHVWFLKSSSPGTQTEGSIWYSSNAGAEWFQLKTGLVSDPLNQVSYYSFNMDNSGTGYAAGTIDRPSIGYKSGFIQRTTDFGLTWTNKEFPDAQIRNMEVKNESTCIVFGNGGSWDDSIIRCRRTTDGGNTWESIKFFENPDSGYSHNHFYTSAYVPSLNTLIVVTSNGLYRSTDFGKTFTKLTSIINMDIQNIAFDNRPSRPENQLAVAIAPANYIIISRDGGRTWIKKLFHAQYINEILREVGVSENVIYLIVGNNTLYQSTDFGETWNMRMSYSVRGIQALDVFRHGTLAAQAYPNVSVTTNGGMNWQQGPLSLNVRLNEIKMMSPSHLFATGYYNTPDSSIGIIYQTRDGGNNWWIQDFPSEMKHLEFTDEQTGYAIGGNALYSTRNGGTTWSVINNNAVSFTFFDNNRGIICTADSSLVTNNGGLTWKPGNILFINKPEKIRFNARGDLFALSNKNLEIFPNAINLFAASGTTTTPGYAPKNIILYPNNPNPLNPSTTISYEIPAPMHVELKIYDLLGREITTLVSEDQSAGLHSVHFDGSSLSSGVYIYSLQAGGFRDTKKLMLLK
ncbi:MAG: T9SS type A sorting domain-containing protein [Methanococcaceae archaeon]